MKISTKGRYGARASMELALRFGAGPVMVREIAQNQQISERYLEQILNTLRTSELVKSTRGAKGGYELAKAPSEITLGDIIRSLEGPLDIVPCAQECDYGRRAECATCFVWQEVKESIEKVLDSITLKALTERHNRLRKQGIIEYNI
ncbi:MAG: Rrf2 family transcriptional regulator [Candidatus Latescibacteria bacterium]|nr:Rrf2 family transcriptional regulator [Candidatus Latescibacterota bacterium]